MWIPVATLATHRLMVAYLNVPAVRGFLENTLKTVVLSRATATSFETRQNSSMIGSVANSHNCLSQTLIQFHISYGL